MASQCGGKGGSAWGSGDERSGQSSDATDWFEAVETNFDFESKLALAMEYDEASQFSGRGDSEGVPVAGEHDRQWDSSPSNTPPDSPVILPQHAPLDLPVDPKICHDPPLTRKEKERIAKRARQCRKRQEKKAQMEASDIQHRASQSEKYPSLNRVRVKTFTAESLPSTSNIFVGKTQTSSTTVHTLEEMLEERFTVLPWDGLKPKGLEDAHGRLFMVMAGRPVNDPNWPRVMKGVDDAFAEAEANAHSRLCKKCKDLSWKEHCTKCFNRRGPFKCYDIGVSFGNGRTEPGNLVINRRDFRTISKIINNPNMVRLVGFINSAFRWLAPNMWKHYAVNVDKVFDHHPHLKRPFSNSVFPTAAFNLGPQVNTVEHTDCTNLPFGWCAIYASGSFDPKRGGHIILRDLKLLIEFPPGSVIFLPSATLMHGNTSIQPHETRRSFTQFATGGLFRWVYYGFRKQDDMKEDDYERFKHSFESAPARRQEALKMFSTAESLARDRRNLANL